MKKSHLKKGKAIDKDDILRESPEYVRTSTAAALTMQLIKGQFYRNAKLYTINLLLTYKEGCRGSCAYCGLNRMRSSKLIQTEKQSFIRVPWPKITIKQVIETCSQSYCDHVERICISMITNKLSKADALTIASQLQSLNRGISVLLSPHVVDEQWFEEAKNVGIDKLGIAIDCVTPEIFDKYRGRGNNGPLSWERYWEVIEMAQQYYHPADISIHVIVGLGETDQEIFKMIQHIHDLGSRPHLFSFFPEQGSQLGTLQQPSVERYRQIQLVRYLIDQGIITIDKITFTDSRELKHIDILKKEVEKIIDSGEPFRTNGCDGKTITNACNRPYSNCTPYQAYKGEIRNFPFYPNEKDILIIRKQLSIGQLLKSN